MNIRYFLASAVLWGFAAVAFAQTPFDITYPIPELGNCASGAECKVYCDDPSHADACLSFAERYGFAKKEDVKDGPGGCTSREQCKTYCDDPAHEEECAAFAEQHGISVSKGEEVRERAQLIREQGGPGGCQSDGECRAYCENPSHMDACIDFAVAKGFMTKEKADQARKGAKLAQAGGPGGCTGEKECRAYCESPDHFEACLAFAEEHDLMPKAEIERIRKLGPPKPGPGGCTGDECRTYCEDPAHHEECIRFAVENGHMSKEEAERARKFVNQTGPGGCRGQACKIYCDDPAHQDECLQFAVDNDLISPQEAERVKKFKNISGPGGCKGEECRDYCEDPAHQEQCFEFAKQNGLISEQEVKMMERGRELSKKVHEAGGPGGCKSDAECQAFCRNPENVEACLAFAVEHGGFNKDEAEGMLKKFVEGVKEIRREGFGGPDDDFERFENERFQRFEQFRALEGQYRRPEMMQGGFPGGPGGCTGPEECMKYCSDPQHQQECGIFSGGPGGPMGGPGMGMPPPGGQMMAGPGGCQGPEECVKYCSDPAHRDECAKFNPSQGAPPPGEMFRQTEPGSESMFQPPLGQTAGGECSGPKPGIPAPIGCSGPVCKDGRWGFDCPQGERIAPPKPGMMPPQGMEQPTAAPTTFTREGVACPQEWHPVCGANGRTYPNACFAKADNATIAKEGPCEGAAGAMPSSTNTYPQPYQGYPGEFQKEPYPDGQYPQPYPTSGDYQQPPAGYTEGTYLQQPPPPPPPTSTRKKTIWDYFFANLLQGLSGGFRTR